MWCFCKKCIVIIIELFQNRNCHSLTLNKAKYLKHWLCYHKNVKEQILQKQKYGSNFNFLYTKNVGSLESSKEFSWVSSKRYFSFIWTYHKKQNILVTLYHNWDSQNQETWPSFRKVNDQIALLHFFGWGGGWIIFMGFISLLSRIHLQNSYNSSYRINKAESFFYEHNVEA